MASSADALAEHIRNSLSPDYATRSSAERAIDQLAGAEGFTLQVLTIVQGAVGHDDALALSGAILFKNHAKRWWAVEEGDADRIPAAERAHVKQNLVELMCVSPKLVQNVLSDALSVLSAADFPDKWPELLPELVGKLGVAAAESNFNVVNGLLATANSIFKRFRDVNDSDSIRKPLVYVLEHFQAPLLELFGTVSGLVDAHGKDGDAMVQLLSSLRLMSRIFYSLNWIDLPEFFEDHIEEWMVHFRKFLEYRNPVVVDDAEEDEPGPLDMLQAAVLDDLNLYAEKYDEEFEPFFPDFVAVVWQLLSETSLMAKHDTLVTTAIKFLVHVVGKKMHESLFQADDTLSQIVQNIVVKNITLRDSDVELFEDNPVEFIRRDIEGSDNDTRRRAASDLVREMCKLFMPKVTELCQTYVGEMLAAYAADATAVKQKDAAIALIIALTVRTSTAERGVATLNELVDIGAFFSEHILPELQVEDRDASPIVKAAAIKFVSTFRVQLPVETLAQMMPLIAPFLGSSDYVVHTYAAAAVERMLTVRDMSSGAVPPPLALSADVLAPLAEPIFDCTFGYILREGYPENSYLMKCVMRVVSVAKAGIAPHIVKVLDLITKALTKVCGNPTHPWFNHYLFETVAVLMKNVCEADASAVAAFEENLFPTFNSVLSANIAEFLPYVFQLMAKLLDLSGAPASGAPGLSESYQSLFPPLLDVSLWETRGNVPALTSLMSAYLRRGADFVVERGHLEALLGVFQKVLSARSTEPSAFVLLDTIVKHVPLATLAPYVNEIVRLVFVRSQVNRAVSYQRQMITALGLVAALHGPDVVTGAVEALRAGLTPEWINGVFVKSANKVLGLRHRRTMQLGFTRMLCETPALAEAKPVWGAAITALVETLEVAEDDSLTKEEAEAELPVDEPAEYSAEYSQLVFAQLSPDDPFDAVDAREALARALADMAAAAPGQVGPLLAGTVAEPAQAAIARYLEAAGAVIA